MNEPAFNQKIRQEPSFKKIHRFFMIFGSFVSIFSGITLYMTSGLVAGLPMGIVMMVADSGSSSDDNISWIMALVILALLVILVLSINIYLMVVGVRIGGLSYPPEKLRKVLIRINWLAIFSPLLWLPLLFMSYPAFRIWLPAYGDIYRGSRA